MIKNGKYIYKGWKLDLIRFKRYLKDKYRVSKSFLFIGMKQKNKVLYANLQKAGYTIIFKPTLVIRKGNKVFTKGNVDAELVLYCMIKYPNYDKAIIVSGDGDFYCLVEYLLKKNKLERILVPNKYSSSFLLWKFRKKIDVVSNLRNKLEFRQ